HNRWKAGGGGTGQVEATSARHLRGGKVAETQVQLIVMVNVCSPLASTPPFAVPPLSSTWTVTVAVPWRPFGVKLRVPSELMLGCELKRSVPGKSTFVV